MEKIQLRAVTAEDLMLLYKWANDPVVRENAFNSNSISLEEHKQWFEKSLVDYNVKIFIMTAEDKPIGQVRLNKNDDVHIISYSIDVKYRAQGYGKAILQLLENVLFDENFVGTLVGCVKKNNVASQLIFKSLGYEETEETEFYRYTKKEFQRYTINPGKHGGGTILNRQQAIFTFVRLD